MTPAREILKRKFEGKTHMIPYPSYEWQEALILAAMEEYADLIVQKYKDVLLLTENSLAVNTHAKEQYAKARACEFADRCLNSPSQLKEFKWLQDYYKEIYKV